MTAQQACQGMQIASLRSASDAQPAAWANVAWPWKECTRKEESTPLGVMMGACVHRSSPRLLLLQQQSEKVTLGGVSPLSLACMMSCTSGAF